MTVVLKILRSNTHAPTSNPVFRPPVSSVSLVSCRSMTPRILFHFLALHHTSRPGVDPHNDFSHLPSSVILPSFFLAFFSFLILNDSSFPQRTDGRTADRSVGRSVGQILLFRRYMHGCCRVVSCRVVSCHHSIFLRVALHWEDSWSLDYPFFPLHVFTFYLHPPPPPHYYPHPALEKKTRSDQIRSDQVRLGL